MNAQKPQPEALDAWSSKKWTDGVQIQDLRELDCLRVETVHHTYEITIINPDTAEVLIRGGEYFPERTEALIAGASLGGSFLKLHGIYIGFSLELLTAGKSIITSPVRGIAMLSPVVCSL